MNEIFERNLERNLKRSSSAARKAGRLLAAKPYTMGIATTGLGDDDEICEIAIVRHDGHALLHTLIRPTRGISPEATKIHGMDGAYVKNAPSIGEALDDALATVDLSKVRLAIYDADFGLRLLRQSAAAVGRYDILELGMVMRAHAHCVMQICSEYSFAGGAYPLRSLVDAARYCGLPRAWSYSPRRAFDDARTTLELLKHMANYGEENDDDRAAG